MTVDELLPRLAAITGDPNTAVKLWDAGLDIFELAWDDSGSLKTLLLVVNEFTLSGEWQAADFLRCVKMHVANKS